MHFISDEGEAFDCVGTNWKQAHTTLFTLRVLYCMALLCVQHAELPRTGVRMYVCFWHILNCCCVPLRSASMRILSAYSF